MGKKMNYDVDFTVTMEHEVRIEAGSPEEALRIVKDRWRELLCLSDFDLADVCCKLANPPPNECIQRE